ncbi:MAG: hypothetical protein DSY32_04935 [Aquifex sp.]|nr:MAG: hypothetical protein DSY32_04935 [Aquifex sp.]
MSQKEKKLMEELKLLRKKKKELIEEQRRKRLYNDTLLKYVFPLQSLIREFNLSTFLPLEKDLKAFVMLTFLYKCNRGKAVKSPKTCFYRLAREVLELKNDPVLGDKIPSDLLNLLRESLKKDEEFFKECYNELKNVKTTRDKLLYILSIIS